MRKVRIPLTALLLTLTLAASGCSSGRLSKITTTGASASPQTTIHATSVSSSEISAEPTPSEPADTRTIEIGGQEYTYAEILKDSGYAELYAPENGPDLSGLPDLFEKNGYQASAEQENADGDTVSLANKDSGASVRITSYHNSADAHEELYRYIVEAIAEDKYIEQPYVLNLYVDIEETYLSVTHFVMSDEGNHFVLYYQSGAQVVRAELPEDALTIDNFMRAMQQFGLSRDDLDYDKEEITLPAKTVECSAQDFLDMLKEYDDPIDKQINDRLSVYGGNVDQTIYWTYEQGDSAPFEKTQFTMNYAYQLFNLADCSFSYFSGENYEGWITDSDTEGYETMIHCGGAGYYIHAKTNDDAMKAHVLEMIEAVTFGVD